MYDENKWSKMKMNLLHSGIPLEVSTWKKLSNRGYVEIGDGEYNYMREEKPFSIDIHAIKFFNTPIKPLQGHIDLLVECKYRTKNKNWYFFKFDESAFFGVGRDNPTQIFIDVPLENLIFKYYRHKRKFIEEHSYNIVQEFIKYPKRNNETFPIASKGTELTKKNEENEHSINHAIGQLRYGSASLLIKNYDMLSQGLYDNYLFLMIIPVVVTTAKLFFQNTSISLEDFEKSNSTKDLFNEVGHLICYKPPDGQLINFVKEKNYFKGIKKHFKYSQPQIPYHNIPNCFYIVNYEKLDDFINKLEENIQLSIKNFIKKYPKVIEKNNRKIF